MKIVTKSINELNFNDTIESAPTENVTISNLDDDNYIEEKNSKIEQPIELGFEKINENNMYLKIYDFKSYDDIKNLLGELDISYKPTIESNNNNYILILGPLDSIDANNLVSTFISKGYKKTEFFVK